MRLRWRFLTVVVAIVTGSLLLAACGGGDGEEGLGLDEYFRRVDEIGNANRARIGALDEQPGIVGEDQESTENYFEGFEASVERALNELSDLDPPAEARPAHDEFVEALSEAQALWQDIGEQVADVESASELPAVLEQLDEQPYDTAGERFDNACVQLQGIANENDIEVYLECE